MKLSILSTAALSLTAAAVPHRGVRRDVVVETETNVAYVTAPAAVVYVDQNGTPQYTSWGGQSNGHAHGHGHGHGHKHGHKHGHGKPTAAPAASSTPTSVAAPAEVSSAPASYGQPPAYSSPPPVYFSPPPVYSSPEAPTTTSKTSQAQASSPAPSPSSDSSPATSSAAPSPSASAPSYGGGDGGDSGSDNSGLGISYAPYNSDDSCKDESQIKADMAEMEGYSFVRIYGTDCDQVPHVLSAASSNGMKVFAGVFDVDQCESELDTLIDAAQGQWDTISTVSIGNEYVNNGGSASTVVAALGRARSKLSAAGYTGKIVTVDTFTAIIDNPSLCQNSDFAAANCHAFFDATVSASDAGEYVAEQQRRVSEACGGMDTMITESGWPSNGFANGVAVPSEANQKTAIASLRSKFSSNMVLFSAYNDAWKEDWDGSFGAEKFWGIYGNAPSA